MKAVYKGEEKETYQDILIAELVQQINQAQIISELYDSGMLS